jgi:two-component system sensor histidine kinase/response regulator
MCRFWRWPPYWNGAMSVPAAILAGSVLAGVYHLTWARCGTAPATRNLSAIALVGEPALLLVLFAGHPWQMDMHMYFFAMIALNIAWFDRSALIIASTATALHHLVLLYLLPYAVFPGRRAIWPASCCMRPSWRCRRRFWPGSAAPCAAP